MSATYRREGGYTLLELLVVLALIGLVTAIATPIAGNVIVGAELRADTSSLATALEQLRREALEREKTITIETREGKLMSSEGEPILLPHAAQVRFEQSDGELTYFGDGTTSGATIRLTEGDRALDLEIAWLTGAMLVKESAP